MPFIAETAKAINEALRHGSLNNSKLQPLRMEGVATVLGRKRSSDAQIETMPALVASDGNVQLIEPNDRYNLIVYHKVISSVHGQQKADSFGDFYSLRSSTEMQMIVIGNSKRIGAGATSIEPLMLLGMPAKVQGMNGTREMQIIPISSVLDTIQVFRSEYPQSEFFLKPADFMLSIRYRVEGILDKRCIEYCLCG